mmetsp:Transcript_38233/g.70528  ORF Transcript_38233/g.70528 Transcript_38233/m.70528 type:complete len:568 (-) Transcript_38233:306-2009(-)
MISFVKIFRIVLIALLVICALLPFFLTVNTNVDTTNISLGLSPNTANNDSSKTSQKLNSNNNNSNSSSTGEINHQSLFLRQLAKDGTAPVPLPRKCVPGTCLPRRYFSTTNQHPPIYYLEPNQDPTGRHGMFSSIPSRPWDESTLTPLDLHSPHAIEAVRTTMQHRYSQLIESDLRWDSLLPKFLPPQFPQWDRAIHASIVSPESTVVGLPPQCCPSNANHKFLTKNHSEGNVLSEEELNDCECRSPRNYPNLDTGDSGGGRPVATLITAFYQMSSKHPPRMYQKNSGQLLATSDPMIIFCEPNTQWVNFFIEQRKHAPTIVVPLPANELRLKRHFSQEKFWKKQYEIDPEGPTHHKGVNTMLYVIWDEKLVLLHTAATLNPFNTTQFVWVDTGYWRNPAPHMYRQSAVRINITKEGVNDDATLLFQMIPYNYDRDAAISGNQVLVGGNSFAGTYDGVSNLYSAFYDTFWTMSATGKFVGSDQKVLYRTCHTYPTACHIHKPRNYRQWLKMLGELLPGVEGGERIGQPLELTEIISPEEYLPIPPNGIVEDAASDLIWKGVKRNAIS